MRIIFLNLRRHPQSRRSLRLASRWVSARGNREPHWLEVELDARTEIASVHIYTGWGSGDFKIESRHYVCNVIEPRRLSYAWRGNHHFAFEAQTLVAQYLSNPSAYDRMPRKIDYVGPDERNVWGAFVHYSEDAWDEGDWKNSGGGTPFFSIRADSDGSFQVHNGAFGSSIRSSVVAFRSARGTPT